MSNEAAYDQADVPFTKLKKEVTRSDECEITYEIFVKSHRADFTCDREKLRTVVDMMKNHRNMLPKEFDMSTFGYPLYETGKSTDTMCNTAGCLAGFVVAAHHPDEWIKCVTYPVSERYKSRDDVHMKVNNRRDLALVTANFESAALHILDVDHSIFCTLFYFTDLDEEDMLAICEAIVESEDMHVNICSVLTTKCGWWVDPDFKSGE
jgi:hypothetical protein